MGLIKSGGFWIFGICLFIILIISGLFLTISLSLGEEVVKPELSFIVGDIAEQEFSIVEVLDEEYDNLLSYCEPQENFEYDYLDEKINVPCDVVEEGIGPTIDFVAFEHSRVGENQKAHAQLELDVVKNYNDVLDYCVEHTSFLFQDEKSQYDFTFPCETVEEGSSAVFDYAIGNLVDEIYYEDYDCDFVDCFEITGLPLFLFSQHTKDYFKRKFIFMTLAALVFAFLMFLFADKKGTALIMAGVVLTISPFFIKIIFSVLASLFTASFFGLVEIDFTSFVQPFFAKIGFVRLLYLVVGFILLGLGIFFRLWSFSSTKKKFSQNDVQKIVKQELVKKKAIKKQ